jgi:hypothetical protein
LPPPVLVHRSVVIVAAGGRDLSWPQERIASALLQRRSGALSRLEPSGDAVIEDRPWLDQNLLCASRRRQVCMTGHFFRHHPSPNAIPLLTFHLHQGLDGGLAPPAGLGA